MVIVDNMEAKFRHMVMCHMLADTTEELLDMANKIGLKSKWIQCQGTLREHFDLCKSKRALAIQYGAVETNTSGVMELMRRKRAKNKTRGLDL